MKVTSIKDAWEEANKIFPTDYEHDVSRSERAGYPIYYSTANGVNAWISDLGNRLEVNLPDGKSVTFGFRPLRRTPPATAPRAPRTPGAQPERSGARRQSGSSALRISTPWNMSARWTTKSARTPP